MKLLSYVQKNAVLPGVTDGESIYELSPLCASILDLVERQGTDYGAVAEFCRGGKLRRAGSFAELPLKPPLCYPRKLICAAGNYRAHLTESGRTGRPEDTEVPWLFCVPPSTVMIGHGEPVRVPRRHRKIDYEGELAVVIGKTAKNILAADASKHIAGYTIFNDVSERAPFMTEGIAEPRQLSFWYTKAFDTFGPMGPYLVTADEIPNPHALRLQTWVNGEERQSSNTAEMIFSIHDLVAFASSFMTLEPGDTIATGTPDGVGKASGRFLKPGDTVRITIDGLGTLENSFEMEAG